MHIIWWRNAEYWMLTSLSDFFACNCFSLRTIQSAAKNMMNPCPKSPNMTEKRKGNVMMLKGATRCHINILSLSTPLTRNRKKRASSCYWNTWDLSTAQLINSKYSNLSPIMPLVRSSGFSKANAGTTTVSLPTQVCHMHTKSAICKLIQLHKLPRFW